MIKKLSALLVCALFINACTEKPSVIQSPDGNISAEISLEKGTPYYSVSIQGGGILKKSPLGIISSGADFTQGLKLIKTQNETAVNEQYALFAGKKKNISYTYNQSVLTFEDKDGKTFDIIFRVANDGIAFRYNLPGVDTVRILSENSGFTLPGNAKAFLTPLSKAKSGWARTNPSYEEPYQTGIPVGTSSDFGQGWTYPALFEVPGTGWALISETGVEGNYVGTHLADDSKDSTYRVEFPHPDQGLAEDSTNAMVGLPYQTPWRMVTIGKTLAPIVESTMAQDLVKPLYMPKYDYKPGRAAWSWIILKDGNTVFDVQKRYIDMAAALNWEYLLVDALWDTQIGRDKIAELAKYAASKHVGLLLWYNSNGSWNDAPQTPKNGMDSPQARQKEMQWMQNIGIKGIKVDFFAGDKQSTMKLYDEILRDANDYGLAVNFHGTTLPRGWDRMYPNFLTCEAVKGEEFCTFEQAVADNQPPHAATLVFTRNAVGPMDFTPMALNPTLGDKPGTGPVRRTTAAFELAMPVIFYSPLQHYAIVPENLTQFPSFVADYLREVPAVWDDTRFIDGYPGKYAVFARRSGNTWYVAGINGQNTAQDIRLNVPFLEKAGNAALITDVDGESNQIESKTMAVSPSDEFTLKLPPFGGFVLIIGN